MPIEMQQTFTENMLLDDVKPNEEFPDQDNMDQE